VPNSFTYDGGEGEITVRAASSGGMISESVHSVNAESFTGKCKFDLFLTTGVDAKVKDWKERVGANSVKALQRSERGETVELSWDNMSLVNIIEREASADGVTSFEFEGDRMAS
jgi:hypothetical protein